MSGMLQDTVAKHRKWHDVIHIDTQQKTDKIASRRPAEPSKTRPTVKNLALSPML
jgi:hypothetical protein